jgi:formylglycine-generating enzyme required for sulfatase activity
VSGTGKRKIVNPAGPKQGVFYMKSKTMFGIIAMVAIVGFSFAACGDGGGTGGDGKKGTAPTIATEPLPDGTVGTVYSQTLAATGDEPVTWSVSVGTLPTGLSLQSGTISGTPTAVNTYTFTVKATNAAGNDTKQFSITTAPAGGGGTAPRITTTSLPGGTVGTVYSQTLKATGGTPITWSIESDTLPTGLDLATDGAITGTPTAVGRFTFTVIATNAAGSDTKQLSITIIAVAITTTSLPNGVVGTEYSQTLTATSGTPVTWNIESGALPTGLDLAADGAITGTPTAAGRFNFTVKATNAAGSVTKQFSITIAFIEMVQIEGGTFTMGSPASEQYRETNEFQHSVTLTGFRMGKYPVTQAQYKAVMETNPSNFTTPVSPETDTANRPVEQVSWYDTLVFCNKLSMSEGLSPAYRISGSTDPADWGPMPTYSDATWNAVIVVAGSDGYRLPTEAQWEYACRAGTMTAYITGNTIIDNTGWYKDNSDERTHTVGEKPANAWGLYDMHGNVYEWCWDWYGFYEHEPQTDPTGADSGGSRVVRGGSYYHHGQFLRSAFRYVSYPTYSYIYFGLRLVRPNTNEQ